MVQLGGLEPPTSCSTNRISYLPNLRQGIPKHENTKDFRAKFNRRPPYLRSNFRYGGSYVVARHTNRSSNGVGKYHDQGGASTRSG